MKVLHILNELKHSGAEVQLRLACNRFKSSGIESHILSTGIKIGEYAVIMRDAGCIIHHIPFRKRLGFFIELLKLIRREKFSVVHVQTERAFVWYVLLAKVAGVPTVARTFRAAFMFSHYLRWKRFAQRQISKRVFRAVHMGNSDSILTVERDLFRNDCLLVRSWTDVEMFRPSSHEERAAARKLYSLEPTDFSIVCVGTCSPVKNHLAVLIAVKKINELQNGVKVVLLHVGAGASLEQEKLYVRQSGIEEYCRFIGVLDDVRPCLYAADAFVMTSLREGLSMAAVEAMATGLPAVLYDSYGLRDLLQDGKGGILVDPDEDRLVEALLLMIQKPELRAMKAREAREIVLNNYSLEASVDKLVRIYKNGDWRTKTIERDGKSGKSPARVDISS